MLWPLAVRSCGTPSAVNCGRGGNFARRAADPCHSPRRRPEASTWRSSAAAELRGVACERDDRPHATSVAAKRQTISGVGRVVTPETGVRRLTPRSFQSTKFSRVAWAGVRMLLAGPLGRLCRMEPSCPRGTLGSAATAIEVHRQSSLRAVGRQFMKDWNEHPIPPSASLTPRRAVGQRADDDRTSDLTGIILALVFAAVAGLAPHQPSGAASPDTSSGTTISPLAGTPVQQTAGSEALRKP